ncbi:Phospho-2-dehydro-3-deoxyheptonate aldolase, Tyr-sensitive [wastewater metagenome]|uniref:3-deoxy-7-phosphoheptulonate synthase n=2 Tax=unclassified sequences TaxID=12908 RepID=A0A5B8R8W6_9ZZZZ|nr:MULTISPECIES: 3-deoxy-7-phosphoheptulonate synthase [Arhodomonas]MCS4504105.1 3-deoxy-7-phosphoheptulonate synthase [Arhodomonas aquaeolei]QEA03904.1 phospho-2-dehydro-3-deoxyheptonate aldolase, Tyr-sensitive [uncultured organism]
MSEVKIDDINVLAQEILPTPLEAKRKLPLSEAARKTVVDGRRTVENIIDGTDHRLLVVVGPCSVHDIEAAKDYAARLKRLHDEVADNLFVVMRVYFEKPRTTVGWKGLINDPYMDDSFHIEEGLFRARELLLHLAEIGLPAATEALDPLTPQYIGDLITWTAIGARTTESQTHREMASGLSTPVGFKNGTDGSLDVAINALRSAASPHSFLGINQEGQSAVIRTRGNSYGHVVLRGGKQPNYDSVSIALCEKDLREAGLRTQLVVDCSHSNSNKDPGLQPLVVENLINQILEGNRSITGMMIESNIGWGNQKLKGDPSALEYGVSITDPCIDWETTETVLRDAHRRLGGALRKRAA